MGTFVQVAHLADVRPGTLLRVDVAGDPVLLTNVAGQLFAMLAECTHGGAPLEEGELDGPLLTCPWHNGQFDVRTGRVLEPPPRDDLPVFAVRVEDGLILVEVP